jgi:serine/threonine-protein kinase
VAPDSYTGQHPDGPRETVGAGNGVGHLGRYQVIGRLATGGMAEVYLALSGELSGYRTLAVVKRILPHLASNQEFIRMFLDEARIAALLDHPNVVRIIEVGHDGDEYFLVMELVQGKPLSAITRKAAKDMNPLTPALSAYIVAQAANGLGYAHNLADADGRPLGVVHRDVSPQNILVSFEGAVKVIDFGIVRALGRVSQTNPGGLKGKIEYMAPEQASSEDVDRRADVFALGIVLWEAVTGRHLFRRDTELATMRAIVDEPIPPPSDITPVHPQLEQIIVRALQKKREDRFQTAQEMAMALERYAFSQEGFSPLKLANYVKELFEVDLAQWKKTVSSALDIEVKPGAVGKESGRFPVIKPDLPTRGPTVALRPGSSSQVRPGASGSDGSGRDPTTDLRTDAPTRRDWIWVGSGVAALALITLAGSFVLTRPRGRGPVPTLPAAPPSQWQATPPAPTPPSTMPVVSPVASASTPGGTAGAAPEAAPAPKAPETKIPDNAGAGSPAAAPPAVRPHAEKPRARSHGAAKRAATQAPAVPSDHRPNPFD